MARNLPARTGDTEETTFNPRVRKIPWRRKWLPTPVYLPGKSNGQRNLMGYSPWDPKKLDMTEQLTLSAMMSEKLLLRIIIL